MSKRLKTSLSAEELTIFEHDSHLLIERIDVMIVIYSKTSNGDKLKELKDIKQKFVEFLNAVDSNNISEENIKQLCDYQNRIEYYHALKKQIKF